MLILKCLDRQSISRQNHLRCSGQTEIQDYRGRTRCTRVCRSTLLPIVTSCTDAKGQAGDIQSQAGLKGMDFEPSRPLGGTECFHSDNGGAISKY